LKMCFLSLRKVSDPKNIWRESGRKRLETYRVSVTSGSNFPSKENCWVTSDPLQLRAVIAWYWAQCGALVGQDLCTTMPVDLKPKACCRYAVAPVSEGSFSVHHSMESQSMPHIHMRSVRQAPC
jgi:hypothetical protein